MLYASWKNTGADSPNEAIWPIGSQFDPLGPIASWGMTLQPSVKYVDDLKKIIQDPLTEFSGSAHE